MAPSLSQPKVLVASFNTWHMDHTARAYQKRGALAGVYAANRNQRGIPPSLYHRCWPFHLAIKPVYEIWPSKTEWTQYHWFVHLYEGWLKRQTLPSFNVVQAVAWGAKTPFDLAEQSGALKVLDSLNSYPATYDAFERRELALWAPHRRPPIPSHIIVQAQRDIHRADLILCPSKWVLETMLANGVLATKCLLNPFGVDVTLFRPRHKMPDHPRFITVGNLRIRKGHQYLFRAMQKVKAEYPRAELVCVGGVYSDFREEFARWQGKVTHIEHLSHEKLAEEYHHSTAFVLPSTEEGFARVIPEAMACGLPIIATHESGATTMVEHGREGLIIPSGNIEELADAMRRIIENAHLCRTLGEHAAQKAQIRNSWQDYGDRCLTAIEDQLKAKLASSGCKA